MRKSFLYSKYLMGICLFCLMVITPLMFTGCSNGTNPADHGEYEVISVTSYEVIVGSNSNGPITETYIAFIYMDNGSACLRKDYRENTNGAYDDCILIGESNKYVVVESYREIDEFLYLTQETYDSVFPSKE